MVTSHRGAYFLVPTMIGFQSNQAGDFVTYTSVNLRESYQVQGYPYSCACFIWPNLILKGVKDLL